MVLVIHFLKNNSCVYSIKKKCYNIISNSSSEVSYCLVFATMAEAPWSCLSSESSKFSCKERCGLSRQISNKGDVWPRIIRLKSLSHKSSNSSSDLQKKH